MIDLGCLVVRLLNVRILKLVHVFNDRFVFLELVLEALSELFHAADHLEHVFF